VAVAFAQDSDAAEKQVKKLQDEKAALKDDVNLALHQRDQAGAWWGGGRERAGAAAHVGARAHTYTRCNLVLGGVGW
jgi:hypothetical protein